MVVFEKKKKQSKKEAKQKKAIERKQIKFDIKINWTPMLSMDGNDCFCVRFLIFIP